MATNPAFHTLLQQMAAMHDKKNADYASSADPYSNFREAAATAGCSVDTVLAVLIGIKLARLKELLTSGKQPNNESIADSRLDLAVYSAIWASFNEPTPTTSKVTPHTNPNCLCVICRGTTGV